jgi:PAS domain S-box-containing protein
VRRYVEPLQIIANPREATYAWSDSASADIPLPMEERTAETRTHDNQFFYDAFNASPIGIALENLEGQPIFVNTSFCAMLGFSEQEMRGKHCVDFSPPEDAEKDWALFQQLRAGSIDRYQLEKRFIRRDGSLVWGRLTISLLNRASPLVVAMVEDITEKKTAEAALSSVTRKLIEAQEQERIRIGRELHDDMGQRLSMVANELQQLHEDPLILPEVRNRTLELQKQIAEIACDIQSLSHELHSAKLQYLGVTAAMRSFCKEFGEQQKMQVEFQTHDLPVPLSPDISLCFFRVLQEALHNSAKHSGVRHFEVQFWGTSDEIHLTIEDSGEGFDREAAKESRGLGLISMEERLKMVKGALSIESQLKHGTTIHARAPLNPGSDSMRAAG